MVANTVTEHGYDVTIVGTGPAGLSAGIFTARAGLETLLVSNGRSMFKKCPLVENFLGFPGIRPNVLLDIGEKQAKNHGARFHTAGIKQVAATNPFELETDIDAVITTDRILVASWQDNSFLEPLGIEFREEDGGIPVDDAGRTSVDDVYACGRVTSQLHQQAIIAAGHGAHVALCLINDDRPDYYNDWTIIDGFYDDVDWETVEGHEEIQTLPSGCTEISHEERIRREKEACKRLEQHLSQWQEQLDAIPAEQ